MKRILFLLLLSAGISAYGQHPNSTSGKNNIYNDAARQLLDTLAKGGQVDTFFLENDIEYADNLPGRIGNTVIKLVSWKRLANTMKEGSTARVYKFSHLNYR